MPPAAPLQAPPYPRLMLALCLAMAFGEVQAESVPLKATPELSPSASKVKPLRGPHHIEAGSLDGVDGAWYEAAGGVEVRNLRESLKAERIHYDQRTDEALAQGQVEFRQERDVLRGSEMRLKLSQRLGEMKDVTYTLRASNGMELHGQAAKLVFDGPNRYGLKEASYTTCPANQPDWMLRMEELSLDYDKSLGNARQVKVEYLGTPILYVPWLDFSLDDQRKTGFLSPSYGVTNERGVEIIAPWYWNIGPQRDATIYPRLMTRRGLQLGGEFRYLEPGYDGEVMAEVLPGDQVAKLDRYRGVLRHRQRFGGGWSGRVDYERVSDNDYFSDLSNLVSQTSRANLAREAGLSYDGGWWRADGRFQAFQTLQDPAAPLIQPYRRLPQIGVAGERRLGSLALLDFNGELTSFQHPDPTFTEGERVHFNPSISLPVSTPYSVFTPKIGGYFTRYRLDNPAADYTRAMPYFSVDAGLFMDSVRNWRGRDYIQTLEPRAYYVYIPYKDQAAFPVFDTVASDLSLDQVFSENQYSGIDRINDANQLTLAVTSRFLEQGNGMERLQVTLGQRYHFDDQRVTLPGERARTGNRSDLIGQFSGQINQHLRIGGGMQFNTGSGEMIKTNLGATWHDGPGRRLNLDYRFTRDSLEQIDISTQWPINSRWHGLGRLNYSFRDSRLVEGLAGFEYNAGCWSLRGVMQRLATSETTSTNAFFLQLELRGLARLGPNPLDVLKRSISGYVPSNTLSPEDPFQAQ